MGEDILAKENDMTPDSKRRDEPVLFQLRSNNLPGEAPIKVKTLAGPKGVAFRKRVTKRRKRNQLAKVSRKTNRK